MSAPLNADDFISVKKTELLGHIVWTWKDLEGAFRLRRYVTSVVADDGSDDHVTFVTLAAALQAHSTVVRAIQNGVSFKWSDAR